MMSLMEETQVWPLGTRKNPSLRHKGVFDVLGFPIRMHLRVDGFATPLGHHDGDTT